jgi:hypothetical protein
VTAHLPNGPGATVSSVEAPIDRAAMLREFARLSSRGRLSFLIAAMHVYAEGVTPDGAVLKLMCGNLAVSDRAEERRLALKSRQGRAG